MKKAITTDLGGNPILQEDSEFIQEQIRELALACFNHLDTSEVTVLNGCEMSIDIDSTVTLSAGWVWYDGEIFQVDADTIELVTPGDELFWIIAETYDTRGDKVFKDNSENDTFLVRKMTMEYQAPGYSAPEVANSKTYGLLSDDWADVSSFENGWSGSDFKVKKVSDGILLHGDLNSSSASSNTFLILDSSYVEKMARTIRTVISSDSGPVTIRLNTTGEVLLDRTLAGTFYCYVHIVF